jgi:hypothetical protein
VVQFWVNDPRGPENARTENITGGGGNTNTLQFSINKGNTTAGGPGQFSVGTFTANANVQAFTLKPDANGVIQMNAIQVRDTSALGTPVLDKFTRLSPASMQLILHGPSGQHYTILTTTNLATPKTNWQALPGGAGTFGVTTVTNVDSFATNKTQFYQIRSP